MREHDTRQIIIAFTAVVLAWSIVCLLTIAFGAFAERDLGGVGRSASMAWRPAAMSQR